MKVSIIMPVYNKIKYLEKTIQSILNQTYKDFELIIVDDGSTDGSEKLCDKFSECDSRIKVIHIKNNGVSNARNIGIENSTGEYIQFIDADDYIDSNMLEDLIDICEKYTPDIIISGVKKVDHNGNEKANIIPSLQGIKNKFQMMENFAEEQKNTGLYGCVSNKFIRREIIEINRIRFDTSIWLAEDLNFYLDLYQYTTNIYFCNKSYYYYLQEAENSSTTSSKKNNYLVQANIILKEKNLLKINNSLNEKNLENVNFVITNFIMSYIYDKFTFDYSKFKYNMKIAIEDKNIMNSISNKDMNKFGKIIMNLFVKENIILIYILFVIRNSIRFLYRKFKEK